MNTPFTRRADAFAEALDRAAAGGAVDAAATAAGVAPLIFLAQRLVSVPLRPVGVGPAFRDALLAQATSTLAPGGSAGVSTAAAPTATTAGSGAATSSALGSTVAQLVAGALSVAVAVTGVGVAADRSVPGDAFYGLKRLVERAERGLAGSAEDKAQALSGEASARLAELRLLLAGGPLDSVELQRVDQLIADVTGALDGALDRLAVGAISQELLDELTTAWNSLADLVPALPASAQAGVLGTLAVVNNRLGTLVDGASPVSGVVPSAPASSTFPASPRPSTPGAAVTPSPSITPTTLPAPASPSGVPSTPVPVPTAAPSGPTVPTAAPTAPVPPGLVVPLPELPPS